MITFFFSDKRTNSTNESLEISLGTKLKIYPKQPSLQAASNEKKKEKKREGAASQKKKIWKESFCHLAWKLLKKKCKLV